MRIRIAVIVSALALMFAACGASTEENDKIGQLNDQVTQYSEENATLSKEKEDLTSKLSDAEKAHQKLQEQYNSLETDL